MKMGVGTRIIFTLFLLVILTACVFTALSAFNIIDDYAFTRIIGSFDEYRLYWGIAAAVLFVVGFPLIFFGSPKKKRRADGIYQKTSETGGVYLTVPALTDLCARYLSSITEISVSRIGVMPQEDKTLKIDCDISMKPETDIPLMTEKIDREMREYIERYSGVNVSAVNIRVLPFKQPKQQ